MILGTISILIIVLSGVHRMNREDLAALLIFAVTITMLSYFEHLIWRMII